MSISGCLRIAYESELDSSLVGLLSLKMKNDRQSALRNETSSLHCRMEAHTDALVELECARVDFAVVTIDRLVEHTSRCEAARVSILGLLLAGDTRGFVELQAAHHDSSRQILGSVNPEAAKSRWEDLTCRLEIDSFFHVGKMICPREIGDELFSGQFGLLELNMYWEGLLGFRHGLVRSSVRSGEFGLPHGFSHVLVVNREFMRDHGRVVSSLRDKLRFTYESLLTQPQKISEVCADAKVFSRHPDALFLQTSFRILAPHFEGFLESDGKLAVVDLALFVNWFNARVFLRRQSDVAPFRAVQLEQLLCDAWD